MSFFRCNTPSAQPALGTKSITANGTYNASSDNLDGYSQVTVNVSGGLPSWISYQDIIFDESSNTFEINFDNTKVLAAIICYQEEQSAQANRTTGFYARKKVGSGTDYIWNVSQFNGSNPPSESATNSNVTFSIDYTTGVITVTASTRPFRSGIHYRTVLMYYES